jgi:excisionase family DNA binding protein
MKPRTPRTLREYREYLQDAFDTLKSDHASDFFDQMQIADQVEEASVLACRFGAGHLIETKHHVLTPREALVLVGRLLAFVEKEVRSPTLDVHEMALRLGCTERTVWRLEAKGLIPAARRVGKVVRWDRDEVEDWLENQAILN